MGNNEYNEIEVNNRIDQLFADIQSYRNSKDFKQMLDFCAKFKSIAPYNAFLANIQQPSSRYLLTASQWKKKYDRGVKEGSRPIAIMIPFGPVQFVFDIGDTFPLHDDTQTDYDKLIEKIANPYKVDGEMDNADAMLHNLKQACAYYGIVFENLNAAKVFAGQISNDHKEKAITLNYGKDSKLKITVDSWYKISINNKETNSSTLFATLCHELGHLFCHHLEPENKWWKPRPGYYYLTQNQKEFEAETVSWLVCARKGGVVPSKDYLSSYLENNDMIPDVSIDNILKAVTLIEQMIETPMDIKNCPYYKKDKSIKEQIDDMLEWQRKNKG